MFLYLLRWGCHCTSIGPKSMGDIACCCLHDNPAHLDCWCVYPPDVFSEMAHYCGVHRAHHLCAFTAVGNVVTCQYDPSSRWLHHVTHVHRPHFHCLYDCLCAHGGRHASLVCIIFLDSSSGVGSGSPTSASCINVREVMEGPGLRPGRQKKKRTQKCKVVNQSPTNEY
jgi:hypothetical protein